MCVGEHDEDEGEQSWRCLSDAHFEESCDRIPEECSVDLS